MGEFAKRTSDGSTIKIGTCEEMLYLRFEDRGKVSHISGSVDVNNPEYAGQLLYRLPYPDEDGILPGDYQEPFRTLRLYDRHGNDFRRPSLAEQPGILQMTHKSGLLLNVPCYHGEKLPEVGPGIKAFWNGKSWSLELAHLRAVFEDCALRLYPVVQCRHCRKCWRFSWSDVWDYIEKPMQDKLAGYALNGLRQERANLNAEM